MTDPGSDRAHLPDPAEELVANTTHLLPHGFELTEMPVTWWRTAARFDAQNFGVDAWPARVWRRELAAPERTYLALVTEPSPIRATGTLVGIGGITHGPDAELLTIAVSEHLRGRGFGGILLSRLLQLALGYGAENVFLEVRSSDAGAQQFYERAGFRRVGYRKNYYRGDDAVVMQLKV